MDYSNRLKRLYYINEAFKVTNLLLEDDETHHYEWDFVNNKFHDKVNNTISDIESSLKKATKFVKTTEDAYHYIQEVISKISELPLQFKKKIFNYAILSVIGLLSYNSILTLNNEVSLNNKLKSEDKEIIKNVIKKVITSKVGNNKETKINKPQYSRPTTYSSDLISFLKWEEGSLTEKGKPVTTAYNIGDGMVTIGYGHAEPVTEIKTIRGIKRYRSENMIADITTINEKIAEQLLVKDLNENARYINDILNTWDSVGIKPKITQGMFDAMVSMSFNMGIGNLRKSDFIQAVKKGDFEKAKELILTTNITYPGHVSRREKESKMFSD